MKQKRNIFDLAGMGLFGNVPKKKDLNWKQAKARYSRLNPYEDADRDGVRNKFDCRPFNRKRQDEIIFAPEDSFSSSSKPKPPTGPPITPPGWMHKSQHFQGRGRGVGIGHGLNKSGKGRYFSKEEIEEDILQGRILNRNMGDMNVGNMNMGNMNMGNMNVDNRLNGPRTEKKGPF